MSNVNTILSELGWQDGFRIPVANERNKQLELEIEKKMKLKDSLHAKYEATEERLKMLKKRASNLKVEQSTNQQQLTVHSTQIEIEDHQYRLGCYTESSLRQEARDFEKEWKEANETVLNIEKELAKITKKIETSKKAIKFEESTLQKLEEDLNRNQENNQLIEKYTKEDAVEYKKMELKRQKLAKELDTYYKSIRKITNETREMEIVLDRTSKLYDQGLNEYRQMFHQWRESAAVLQRRHDDIEKILRETETLQEVTQDKKNVLQEAERFLTDQKSDNKHLEETIKQTEKKLIAVKEEHSGVKATFGMYEAELRVQKNIAKDLSQRLQRVRRDIKRKDNEIQNQIAKMEDSKIRINDLTAKLEDINSQKLNVEGRTKELENMMEEQEKRRAAMLKEINRLQVANLRTKNQIKELESESKILKMQYQNEYKKSEHLDTLYATEETILEESKEALYQMEFELQKSEMKLERLRGHERDKFEAKRKLKKMEELQITLAEKTEVSKLLQRQITNLEHDMKKISNRLTNDTSLLEELQNKKQNFVLLMDGGEKRLKAARTRNEERQVEESMLRLRVSQMEKIVANLGSNVYNLEKYRLELEAAVRERKVEITVQEESLIIEKRVTGSECSDLRRAISERKGRIQQLQTRYENGIATFGTNPDGTPASTTYLKIQSAQERYLLQEQGDKLDESIRKTEQEIQSMENTLRVINACNDKYKISLNVNEKNELEQEEQRKLDQELSAANKTMKLKQEELRHLSENLGAMKENYTKASNDVEKAKEQGEEKELYMSDLKRNINEQREKISRAEKNLQSARKDIENLYATSGEKILIIQEKEVELRDIQEQNATVLQDIAEFTIRHVEAESYIKKLLAEKNIELPSVVPPYDSSSPISSQRIGAKNSAECRPKTSSCTSVLSSSRDSVGSIVNIEAQFQTNSAQQPTKQSSKQSLQARAKQRITKKS